jgi:hypothetical protein
MATLPSGLEEIIADDEDLARYLTPSSQFNAVMAKPAAFLPNPKDRETSVFRHGSEPRDRLWAIGVKHAAGGRNLHGAAICKARHVRAAQLYVACTRARDYLLVTSVEPASESLDDLRT